MESLPSLYEKGQRVCATVEKTHPYGVFVRLEDGSRAYIRRRELSLEGDQDPRVVSSEGQPIEAVIKAMASQGRIMELSVKDALPDPWETFAHTYHLGDLAHCQVKHLFPNNVLVNILPGVDGYIPTEELVSWHINNPADLLWVGDRLEAVITRINPISRKVWLSLRRRKEQIHTAQDLMEQLRQNRSAREANETEAEIDSLVLPEVKALPIELPGPLMLIEDKQVVRDPLVAWLINQGCEVHSFENFGAAKAESAHALYSAAIIDLDIPKQDFTNFLRFAAEHRPPLQVAVLADPDALFEKADVLEGAQVAILMKPLETDELRQVLIQVSKGAIAKSQLEDPGKSDFSVQTFQNLGELMRSGKDLHARLAQALASIMQSCPAEYGVVFHLDPISLQISRLVQAGSLPIRDEYNYKLIDSPVKDVITEEKIIWENNVSQVKTEVYHNLSQWLDFESCIGIPIESGGQTSHALFLFHHEAGAFNRYHVRDAMAIRNLMEVSLESQILQERVHSLSRILLSGNLAAALGHEINNQLSSLDLYLSNIRSDVNRLDGSHAEPAGPNTYPSLSRKLDEAAAVAGNLRQTVDGFRRLMDPAVSQSYEVNQIIRQAVGQVMPLAQKAGVTIHTHLGENLPKIQAGGTGLYQVLLNLMLNAIQQMSAQPGDHRQLTIASAAKDTTETSLIQVRVTDTGPGIHYKLWEKIFALGFTTRTGGSGLGLFIARSLIESIGGRVCVEESYISLGTTFLVDIPTEQNRK